jgi:hypothetical protein
VQWVLHKSDQPNVQDQGLISWLLILPSL